MFVIVFCCVYVLLYELYYDLLRLSIVLCLHILSVRLCCLLLYQPPQCQQVTANYCINKKVMRFLIKVTFYVNCNGGNRLSLFA